MIRLAIILSIFCVSPLAFSSAQVLGTATTFLSPNGVTEKCVILNAMPGGNYSQQDKRIEQRYCSFDIYKNTSMCPKTWSTSPGTMFYPLARSVYDLKIEHFENTVCTSGQKHIPIKAIAFKNTMNEKDTSGTFSTASLLYYHFSRYFDMHIKVPVAVFRSIDKNVHETRVSLPGKHLTHRGLIHNAWKDMLEIEQTPTIYHSLLEVFTADKKQIYGVLLRSEGKRYNLFINGTRQSGWGEGQNRDFQQTPPYLALRSDKKLRVAIAEGVKQSKRNQHIAKAMKHKISAEQIVFWMQDLTEITLLDFIFSQQDRIGNIDYKNIWLWQENGEIKTADSKPDLANNPKVIKIKQTYLNDNDAGGRVSYVNYTKKTAMLEKIRHYNKRTYMLLMKLDKDFADRGELYQYLDQTFGLSEKQKQQIVKNTHLAANIIRSNCQSGLLKFDLDAKQFFLTGDVMEEKISCDL